VIAAFAPSPVRRVARKNNLPVDSITEVRVLDPYFASRRRQWPGGVSAPCAPRAASSSAPKPLRRSRCAEAAAP